MTKRNHPWRTFLTKEEREVRKRILADLTQRERDLLNVASEFFVRSEYVAPFSRRDSEPDVHDLVDEIEEHEEDGT